MRPIILSLYMDNANPEVVKYQKKVVDKFRKDIPFHQLLTGHSHGRSMELIIQGLLAKNDDTVIIFLDIDAIPLHRDSFDILLSMTHNGKIIAGAPQSTNHLPDANGVFVAPSIMAIGTKLYFDIGSPRAEPTESSDVAELWSMSYRMVTGNEPEFLDILGFNGRPAPVRLANGKVISVDHWVLDNPAQTKFGLNTRYGRDSEELFFHSYQSFVPGQNEYFINQCKAILTEI